MAGHKVVVFDLDDTLYKEIDFLKSAYRHIASLVSNCHVPESEVYQLLWDTYNQNGNAFETVIKHYGFLLYTVQWMLDVYHNHKPSISLDEDTLGTLERLKDNGITLCIVSDGRRVQQMNKIEALGLKNYVCKDDIIINTDAGRIKPDLRSFRSFMKKYGKGCDYWYVGNDAAKDFIAPNSLKWGTVCLLDDGRNIHRQTFAIQTLSMPNVIIRELSELLNVLNI